MNNTEFPAYMNILANSHDVLISHILQKKGLLNKDKITFGTKITKFGSLLNSLNLPFEKNQLIQSLRKFNNYWNIVKHSAMVGNAPFCYFKGGVITEFDENLRKSIDSEFTENQIKIMKINSIIQSNLERVGANSHQN